MSVQHKQIQVCLFFNRIYQYLNRNMAKFDCYIWQILNPVVDSGGGKGGANAPPFGGE